MCLTIDELNDRRKVFRREKTKAHWAYVFAFSADKREIALGRLDTASTQLRIADERLSEYETLTDSMVVGVAQ